MKRLVTTKHQNVVTMLMRRMSTSSRIERLPREVLTTLIKVQTWR